jgi:hypothetical protein
MKFDMNPMYPWHESMAMFSRMKSLTINGFSGDMEMETDDSGNVTIKYSPPKRMAPKKAPVQEEMDG